MNSLKGTNNMSEESKKVIETIDINEAIKLVDEIPSEKKNRFGEFLKIFDRFQKQKGTGSEEIIALMTKGIAVFPESEIKILIHVFARIKLSSISMKPVKDFVEEKCTTKMRLIDSDLVSEFTLNLNKSNDITGSVSELINSIKTKNERMVEGKLSTEDLFPSLYIFLVSSVKNSFRYEPKRTEALLDMERAFVEEAISINEKEMKYAICHNIPQLMARGQYKKGIASMCYLYYDFKPICNAQESTINQKNKIIADLNTSVDEKNTQIRELKILCSELSEDKEKLTKELLKKADEKEQAEDRLEFETNRIERQYQSQNQGLAKKYNNILGLEIDGIEDIIPFLPENAQSAVQERVDRMRQVIKEIGDA